MLSTTAPANGYGRRLTVAVSSGFANRVIAIERDRRKVNIPRRWESLDSCVPELAPSDTQGFPFREMGSSAGWQDLMATHHLPAVVF